MEHIFKHLLSVSCGQTENPTCVNARVCMFYSKHQEITESQRYV